MSGRDHSIECETCGVYRGGLNDLECYCSSEMHGDILYALAASTLSQNLAIAGALCASFDLGIVKALEPEEGMSWEPGCGSTIDDEKFVLLEVTREQAHRWEVCMSPTECDRCGRSYSEWRTYMVTDAVWTDAGLPHYGCVVCLDCLETILGRRLVSNDFPNYPVNDWLRRAA